MNWHNYRVFPLRLPTGAGKTAIAMSIMRGCSHNQVIIVCPNNALVMQYVEEYPDVVYLIGKEAMGACSKCKGARCPTPCLWKRNKELVRKGHSFITNGAWLTQQSMMVHGMNIDPCITILDECDQVINYARSKGDIVVKGIVTDNPFVLLNSLQKDDALEYETQVLKKAITKEQEKFAIVPAPDEALTRGSYTCLTNAVAKSLRGRLHTLLLSATVSTFDVKNIGAIKPAPIYDAVHPIPQAMRPVYWKPMVPQFAETYIQELSDVILKLYNERKENTVVHCTYAVQTALYEALYAKLKSKVIMSASDSADKMQCLKAMSQGTGMIWIASGCSEGLNLINDTCRLQVIPELIFPYLGDALVQKRMAQKDGQDWYIFQALRHLIQACGRSSRHANDYSRTYILYPKLPIFWTQWVQSDMLPEWFQIENAEC
jgi:Rad3-related DNA helicase